MVGVADVCHMVVARGGLVVPSHVVLGSLVLEIVWVVEGGIVKRDVFGGAVSEGLVVLVRDVELTVVESNRQYYYIII